MAKAQALLLSCIDFRFQKMIEDFMEIDQKALKAFDRVTIAGGVKQIVHPDNPAIKDFILSQINISIKLHDPESIYLMNHEDCGAYGINNDLAIHTEDLREAKKIIQEIYPHKTIKLFQATFEGVVEVDGSDAMGTVSQGTYNEIHAENTVA